MQIAIYARFIFITTISLCITSCQDQVSNISNKELKPAIYLEFRGEQVLIPENLTEEDFSMYLSETEADRLISPNMRTSGDRYSYLEGVNESFFFAALNASLKKYPDLSKTEFDEKDIRQFICWIPSITSSEMAVEKKGLIWDYLNVLLKKDIQDFIILNKGKNGFRTSNLITPWGLHAYDVFILNSDPLAANCWGLARIGAEEARKNKYGNDDRDSYPCNEFKHAVLNAFSVGEMNLRNPSKQFGIKTTRKFANAHEYVPADNDFNHLNQSWILGNSHENGMDLHNNLVGRTYMQDEVSVFLGHVSWVPGRNKIQDDIYNFGRIWISDGNSIRLRNPDRTWAILGDKDSGRNYDVFPAVHKTLAHLLE